MSRTVLAVDIGKSRCRATLVGEDGRAAPHEGLGTPGLAAPEGVEAALAAIALATQALVSSADAPPDTVAVGIAGAASAPAAARELADTLARRQPSVEVLVCSDMTAWHAGALAGHDGVVVAAGTGSVVLALAADGRSAVADGTGYLLGDAGSGWWIGRRGLDAALRHHDGRGGSPDLAARAERALGPLDDLPRLVHGSPQPARVVASFAPEVLAAADDGDPVAAQIWVDAGQELATSTAAAARTAGLAGPHVALTGGLTAAGGRLTAPFTTRLAELLPGARPRAGAGDALDGVARLAATSDLPHEALLVRARHPQESAS